MELIYCFGDSLTYGELDDAAGGWCERLKRYFLSHQSASDTPRTRVYNLGVPGETTDGLTNRIESEIKSRYLKGSAVTLILQYGLNDIVWHKNKNKVPLEYFRNNLMTAIASCAQYHPKILFIELYQFAEQYDGTTNQDGHKRFLKDISRYNQCIETLCVEPSIAMTNLRFPNASINTEILSSDGLHLNSLGHQLVAEQVYSVLKK